MKMCIGTLCFYMVDVKCVCMGQRVDQIKFQLKIGNINRITQTFHTCNLHSLVYLSDVMYYYIIATANSLL